MVTPCACGGGREGDREEEREGGEKEGGREEEREGERERGGRKVG